MKRKHVYLAVMAVTAGLTAFITGCGVPVTGSGRLETREMDFSDFSKVEIGSSFEATVTRGDSYRVSITLDDNVWDRLEANQEGDTLRVGLKQPSLYIHVTQKVDITAPALEALSLSGASKGTASGFSSAQPLAANVSGASSLDIDNVRAGDAELDVSGASRLTGSVGIQDGELKVSGASTVDLEGSGANVDIEASGASHANLADFAVADAGVTLSGASSATVNASGRLDVNVSGASRLEYIGNPTLGSVEVSGASTIKKR